MKNKCLLFSILIVSGLFSGNRTIAQSWELLNTGLSSSIKVHSIVFTAQSGYQTGYAVGGDNYTSGLVIKTTDGGTTWSAPGIIASEELYSVSFPSNDTGYTCSMEGKVYKTTNGGATWQLIFSPIGGQTYAVAFRDAMHGVLGSPGVIRYTSNGGQTWQTGSGSGNTNSQDISWCEGDTYVATGYGETNISTNGGQNWNSQTTPALSLGCGSYGTKFMTTCGDYGTIRVSQDYGNSWIDHDNVGDLNHDAAYWDSNYIYVVGTPGIVLKSTNGGQSFSGDGNLGTGAVFCVFITPSFTVYTTGSQGKIWRKQVAYPYAMIEVSADSIRFDTLVPGSTQVKTFSVTNNGNQDLIVSGITSSRPEYSANPGTFTLPHGQTKSIELTFAPQDTGSFPSLLTIASNAPAHPVTEITLDGNAAFPVGITPGETGNIPAILWPDPFTDQLFARFSSPNETKVKISMTDAYGKRLFECTAPVKAGSANIDIKSLWPGISRISAGLYIVTISSEKFTFTKNIIKVR